MTNEHDEAAMSPGQRMHARLCAYVLGEASEAERAEVDAALAADEGLRAEKARVEATIGLVTGTLQSGAGDVLSPHVAAALDAAAARRAQPRWYRSTWARAAAAIVVVAGGIALLQRPPRDEHGDAEGKRGRERSIDGLEVAQGARDDAELAKNGAPKSSAPVGEAAADPADSFGTRFDETGNPLAAFEGGTESAQDARIKALRDSLGGAEEDANIEVLLAQREAQRASGEAGVNFVPGLSPSVPFGRTVPTNPSEEPVLKDSEISYYDEAVESLEGAPDFLADSPFDSKGFNDVIGTGGGAGGMYGGRFGGKRGAENGPGGDAFDAAARAQPTLPGLKPSANPSGPATPGPATPGSGAPPARGAVNVPGAKASGATGSSGAATENGVPLDSLGYSGEGRGGDSKARVDDEYELAEAGDDTRREVTGADVPGADKGGVAGSDEFSLGRGERAQSAEQLRAQLERSRFELLRRDCLVLPRRETPRDMFFRFWGDNPFEYAALDRQSTFSADVDTASYTLARKYLLENRLPEKAQIRTEEFVNYFKGDVPPPREGAFAIATELAPSLFGDSTDQWILRVAIRGRDVSKQERLPLALTFVIDVSGSMNEENRLELVKHALRMLVAQLDGRDTISLVKFSNDAALVLPPTSARNKELIESAIYPLRPEGSTNTESGLRMGYAQAAAALTKDANNRVVLLTDGVANVGIVDPDALVAMVARQRSAGILLNTIGVGMDNHNDNLLEQLADKGDGLCNYVDDEGEVRRALVDNFTGAFEPIARDTKIQVEFDPAQVERYRLLGYENRAIADADFRNDKVDAAEIGAGHQVVALYEIVRKGGLSEQPLATVNLRWKEPYRRGVADSDGDTVREIKQAVVATQAAGGFLQTSAGYRRSVLVAQFAEFLRRSYHARHDSLDRLIAESKSLAAATHDNDFDEFVAMVEKSRELILAERSRRDWIDDCGDLLRHHRYLQTQIDELHRRLGVELRRDGAQRNLGDLQRRLDELRTRIEGARSTADQELIGHLQAENIELQRRLLDLLERLREQAK